MISEVWNRMGEDGSIQPVRFTSLQRAMEDLNVPREEIEAIVLELVKRRGFLYTEEALWKELCDLSRDRRRAMKIMQGTSAFESAENFYNSQALLITARYILPKAKGGSSRTIDSLGEDWVKPISEVSKTLLMYARIETSGVEG